MTDRSPLVPCSAGGYQFVPGIDPYSSGVVSAPGHEIVHARLQLPLPYRDGFDLIARHLEGHGRPRAALCAIELRLPAPLTFAGFGEFNRGYRALLADWGLLIDGLNPIARTNVAPVVRPPSEAALYGFAYTVASEPGAAATFIVAGSGELRRGATSAAGVVRPGETSAEALAEKAEAVMGEQSARLAAVGMTWADVTAVAIYCAYPIHAFLASRVLEQVGPAAAHGVHWFLSHPPIQDLAYEMDGRGVRRELRLGR